MQTTDYPWSGRVSITINPAEPRRFGVRIRVPARNASTLYSSRPPSGGIISLALNGEPVTPAIHNGYAVITREWQPGDRVDMVLPMHVQRIRCSDRVQANLGRVALRRGPLIYNIESVDQDPDQVLGADSPLSARWRPDLLGGVMVINGVFENGASFTAIPNYARLNRGGRSIVWIREP
jgi:uncharacterized protein